MGRKVSSTRGGIKNGGKIKKRGKCKLRDCINFLLLISKDYSILVVDKRNSFLLYCITTTLNVILWISFGGFSVSFLLQLYIMSYVFNYCKWHRVPLHYVTIVNILALYDTFVGIPLSDLQMLRVYLIIAGVSLLYFVYFKNKKANVENL